MPLPELAAQLGATGGAVVDIRSLVANRRTVMVEEVSCFTIAGTPVSAVVMAVFELDADGRIKQWREAYDLTSLTDKIEAATRRSNACGG